jgi:hypothetical protein
MKRKLERCLRKVTSSKTQEFNNKFNGWIKFRMQKKNYG